ncbi:MAG: DNA methylase [Planctomycetota bacterium]
MAQSPTHRFGQIIGEVLEESLREPLAQVARHHGLYLDYKHPRKARGGRSKVQWKDHRGNRHDLDFVLESGGCEETVGSPKAFIEIAYRRYTKHSRNKAQEIQGAITPLFETFRDNHPFLGVVLAGVFTEASITQLRSLGFGVLHIEFEGVVKAFQTVGIDARFDERTSDREVQRKVKAWEQLTPRKRLRVAGALEALHRGEFDSFLGQLGACLIRRISKVFVLPLHGQTQECTDVATALDFIEGFDESESFGRFDRYEIMVCFNNGDEIRGSFGSKIDAVQFLHGIQRDAH